MLSFKILILFFTIFSQIPLSLQFKIFDYSHLENSQLYIQVGPLTSKNSDINYQYISLGRCDSKTVIKGENTLNEILTSQKLYTTNYIINTNINKYCQILCYNNFGDLYSNLMKGLIKRKYVINYYLDKLPAGYMSYNSETKEINIEYNTGIPLGEVKNNHYIIYNHLQFHILLHEINDKKFEIVGFNILPLSIKHDEKNPICKEKQNENFSNENNEKQMITGGGKFLYTYDIIFEKSNIT